MAWRPSPGGRLRLWRDCDARQPPVTGSSGPRGAARARSSSPCSLLLVPSPRGRRARRSRRAPGTRPAGKRSPEEPETRCGPAYPGTNEAHDSYGYPWPAAPDCDESNVGTGGCVNDGLGLLPGPVHLVGRATGSASATGFAFSNWYDGRPLGQRRRLGQGRQGGRHQAQQGAGGRQRGLVRPRPRLLRRGGQRRRQHRDLRDEHRRPQRLPRRDRYPGGAGWPDKFLHLADVVPVDYTAPDAPPALAATAGRARRGGHAGRPPADDLGVTGYRVLRNGMPARHDVDARPTSTARPRPARPTPTPSRPTTRPATCRTPPRPRCGQGVGRAGRLARATSCPARRRVVTVDDRDAGLRPARHGAPPAGRLPAPDPGGPARRAHRPRGAVGLGARARRSSPAPDDRVWFCRVPRPRGGAPRLPAVRPRVPQLGLRPDRPRPRHARRRHLAGRPHRGPARCGTARRPGHLLGRHRRRAGGPAHGRRTPARATRSRGRSSRPSDGVAFCRVVEGRAACTELGGQGVWRRSVVRGTDVAHGRWLARADGSRAVPGRRRRVPHRVAQPLLITGCPSAVRAGWLVGHGRLRPAEELRPRRGRATTTTTAR